MTFIEVVTINIAIYSRKSKFIEKSESTDNQINICKTYCESYFKENINFIIYEDEGYSGSNTNRPAFQKMNSDLLCKNINVVVCYKLDRISRDVSDFNILIKRLEKLGVDFICIKEQFDTTTPIGRAMMNISATFAQLERESIGERISDNLLELSRQGRFVSSKPPFGFNKKKSIYIDKNGKQKNMNILTTNEKEKEIIKLVFNKYIEFESINKVYKFLLANSYKTRGGNDFSVTSVRRILANQYYCVADKNAYNYFIKNGATIISDISNWNGECGVCVYRRTNTKTKQLNENDKIIYSVGDNEGFISSSNWIDVQNILNKHKNSSYRNTKSSTLLSGILKCSKCGSYMRPQSYQKNGTFYYICELKEKSCKELCNAKNLRGDTLDKEFILELKKTLQSNINEFNAYIIDENKKTNLNEQNYKESIISKNNKKILEHRNTISKLIINMSKVSDEIAINYITKEINFMNKSIESLVVENGNIENQLNIKNNIDFNKYNINSYIENRLKDKDVLIKKRNILKEIVKFAYWDGECITVDFI